LVDVFFFCLFVFSHKNINPKSINNSPRCSYAATRSGAVTAWTVPGLVAAAEAAAAGGGKSKVKGMLMAAGRRR
jgi:hypothetical protein